MAYQFTKDLETGNAMIDQQHRQLIEAVNALLEACAKGQGRAQIESTAKFMAEYTTKHFADEEKLQIQYKYPDYTNHKRYHEEFKKVVADLMRKLNTEGPNVVLVGQINSALAGWLLNHIKQQDKKLAVHIKSQS